MIPALKDKRIVLGVTGSIACYKAADLASKLHQAGCLVDVILTPSALNFITTLTFQSVTGRQAYTDEDLWGSQGHVLHIGLAHEADLVVVAPATANTLAKLANGAADNLLSLTAMAAVCPTLAAPAMDGGMYAHPATQSNIKTLKDRSVNFIGPVQGYLASGQSGIGRLAEPQEIFNSIRYLLTREGPLAGKKLVISAGPTQEPLDPVRFISNHSSGKQGYAFAQAGLDLGAQVTLISGPVALSTPHGADRVEVQTAQEMLEAVLSSIPGCDALVMAAAVGDYSPADYSGEKIKKNRIPEELKLKNTPDILKEVANIRQETGRPLVTVGFAAETQDLLENARLKLEEKKLDLIVANDISASNAGFNVETNKVMLLFADGKVEDLPLMNKTQVAQTVLEHIVNIL